MGSCEESSGKVLMLLCTNQGIKHAKMNFGGLGIFHVKRFKFINVFSLLMLTFVTEILIYESNNIIMTVISLSNVCTRFFSEDYFIVIYTGSLLAVLSVFLIFPGKIPLLIG